MAAGADLDADDILVVEMAEDLDLAERALRVGQVLERLVNLLDRDLLAGEVVERGADDAIGAVADRLDQRVPRIDVEARARHHEAIDGARRILPGRNNKETNARAAMSGLKCEKKDGIVQWMVRTGSCVVVEMAAAD